MSPRPKNRSLATAFASIGFLALVAGITYFAILVFAVHFGDPAERAANYYELGFFISGGLEWYKDGRVFGAAALVFSLLSILFGVHPLARITGPISGVLFVVLYIWGDAIRWLIEDWARAGG